MKFFVRYWLFESPHGGWRTYSPSEMEPVSRQYTLSFFRYLRRDGVSEWRTTFGSRSMSSESPTTAEVKDFVLGAVADRRWDAACQVWRVADEDADGLEASEVPDEAVEACPGIGLKSDAASEKFRSEFGAAGGHELAANKKLFGTHAGTTRQWE